MLRFFTLWDDADSLYGESRPVTIHYYLVDDTVEVAEVHQPNSGRDPFPILMRRQRLPKKIKSGLMQYCVLVRCAFNRFDLIQCSKASYVISYVFFLAYFMYDINDFMQ